MATASEAAAPMGAVGARVGAGPLEDDSASRRIPLLAAGAAVLLTMQATVSFHKGVSHPVGGEPEDTSNLKFGSLSLFASFLFVLFSNALSRWDPTRGMGKVLVERVTSMVGNWQNETLRSFVELFIWMGVMWATFTATERGFFSLLCATMSGAVVVLCGECLTAQIRKIGTEFANAYQRSGAAAAGSLEEVGSGSVDEIALKRCKEGAHLVDPTLLCIYGYGVIAVIYHNVSDITVAGLLAGLAGCALLATATLIRCWPPTRRLGEMLQDRILNTRANWTAFPSRSASEVSVFLGVTIGAYVHAPPEGSVLHLISGGWPIVFGVQAGLLAGFLVCVLGEIVLGERELVKLRRPAAAPAAAPAAGAHSRRTASAPGDAPSRAVRAISLNELSAHAVEGDCWIAVHGAVYDISSFTPRHPGGDVIMHYVGRESGDHFELFHSKPTQLKLRPFLIGRLEEGGEPTRTDPAREPHTASAAPSPQRASPQRASPQRAAAAAPPAAASAAARSASTAPVRSSASAAAAVPAAAAPDAAAKQLAAAAALGEQRACSLEYQRLREALWAEGAFVPSTRFFVLKQLLALSFVLSAVAVLLLSPESASEAPWTRRLLVPILLGLALQQAAFVGHDTMHNGVVSPRGISLTRDLLGQLNAGVILGISTSMWLEEHNAHHAYTLRPHGDPQFKYFPLWLQSTKEVPYWRSELPARPAAARALVARLTRLLVRIQHLTILPIVIVVGRYNFLAISWAYALKNRRWTDLLGMALHACWFGAFLYALFPSNWERLQFVLIHYSFGGILHVQLLLSHLGMAQYTAEEEASLGVFQFQLLTTRNVRSSWYSHWFHGGLEMQIEHHLFPQLPRHKLREVAPRVKAIAERHAIPYVEVGFWEGCRAAFWDHMGQLTHALATVDFF